MYYFIKEDVFMIVKYYILIFFSLIFLGCSFERLKLEENNKFVLDRGSYNKPKSTDFFEFNSTIENIFHKNKRLKKRKSQ